jgi:hypothetical protein
VTYHTFEIEHGRTSNIGHGEDTTDIRLQIGYTKGPCTNSNIASFLENLQDPRDYRGSGRHIV